MSEGRSRNTAGLTAHARAISQDARRRVVEALNRLEVEGRAVTFRGVAEAAQVTTAYLYAQPDLRERIETLRRRPVTPQEPSRVRPRTDKSREVLLAAKEKRIRELEEENRRLKAELQTAYGKLYERL